MNLKHKDTGQPLFAHMNEVLVLCGRCGKPGAVEATGQLHWWKALFRCAHCLLALNSDNGDWLGAVVFRGRRPCSYCGHKWLYVCKPFTKMPVRDMSSLKVTCPKCACATAVPVKAEPQKRAPYAFDPHFGMPLRLAVNTRLGVVWAYNARHLAELKAYVSATLRERTRGNITRSLFARLPAWIKLARNRDSVLQAISRLERKLLGAD